MCAVSNIGNFYDKWWDTKPFPTVIEPTQPFTFSPFATQEDIEKLRKEIQELKKLLEAAIRFDRETGQKDCHQEEKLQTVRKVAELVGVDLEDVLKPKA